MILGSKITAMAGGILCLAVSGAALVAAAQEYCVSCSEPDALYRCIIDGARPGSGTPLQMFCVTKMAELGKHGSCSINRVTVLECNGRSVRVAMPASVIPPAPLVAAPAPPTISPPPPPPAAPIPAAVPPPPVPPSPDTPKSPEAPKSPDTLIGVIEQAGQASKEKLKSTGRAIGSGAKKTWNCVTSLFSRC